MSVVLHRSKTSTEKKPYTLDFTNSLPSGTTISSATATATKVSDGTTDTSVLEETTLTTTDTTAVVRVKAGTSGETYRILIQVNGSDSFLLDEVYIFLKVRDVPTS
jgi:hypothetical protein